MKFTSKVIFVLSIIAGFNLALVSGQSITPGFIYLPATGVGAGVLDPNNDGYSSISPNGFISNDVGESEIPFVGLPPLFPELPGDNVRGPGCGFTDLVDYNGSGVYSYLDASNNLMFRFRLGNSIKGSKAYSILIDTDGKMGNSGANADPNYIGGIKGNPGFEMEIVLETNFRVALYDVDGSTSGTLKASLPVDQYSQESVAISTVCGDPDYFYDFFIPFSVITTYFPSITPATPVRFLGVTVMAPKEALGGPTSDTYGVPDNGNWNQEWTDIINAQPPTCFACTGGGYPVCSDAPVVNSPIAVGATSVSGTSTEANGTTIQVYKNGILIGSTTVSAGAWTLSGISPALISGDAISAKAQAVGEAACLFSNQVILNAGCTASPTITCLTKKGAQGNGPAGAPIGTTIKGYQLTSSGPVLIFTVATTAGNTWLFDCSGGTSGCTGGINCIANGSYYVTGTAPGQCESDPSSQFDLTCGSASTTPTVTTNPIYNYTTTINGTSSTATGEVYMFINGAFYNSVAIAASAWSFTGLSLNAGDTLTFKKVDGTNCLSAAATIIVQCKTSIVTIDSPISNGATNVSGTSTEVAGTTITVYRNGISIGTTTVLANGTWTKSGIGPLSTGDNIYVTQTSTACNVSAASPTVTVVGITPPPVIVGTYYEKNTVVNGTSTSPAGTVIRVYIDGYFIGTTTVTGLGTWSLAGLDTTVLYAGGVLSATAQETGLGVSVLSNLVTVLCVLPSTNISVSALTPFLCTGDSASVQITGTESLVIYAVVNQATTTALSVSKLGNGSNITILTFPLASSQWVKIKADKVPLTCSSILKDSLYITVSNYPDSTVTTSAPASVCSGSTATITVTNSQVGMQYQLRDSTTNVNVGSSVAGTGGTINLVTGTLTSVTTFYIWATNTTTSANCSRKIAGYKRITITIDIASNAGSNQSLCNVSSVTLAGNSPSPGTGTWTLVSGPNSPVITAPSNPSSTVTGMIAGVYTFRWTIVNGPCSDFSDVQITIYSTPTVSNAGPDQSVCNSTSTTLAGNSPASGTGAWTQVSGPNTSTITSTTSPGTTVASLIPGIYIFRWTISNGACASSQSDVQVSVYALPTVSNAGADQNLCNVTSTSLAGNAAATGSGNWTLVSGPNSPTITAPSSATSSVTGMIAGTYLFRWTISNGSCTSSTDDVQIIIYATPTVSAAGPDQSLCNVVSVTMAGNAPAIGSGNWSTVSGPNSPTITTASNPSTTITGLIPGVYTFSWTISNGVCAASSDNIQVTIYALPTIANAGADQNLCNVTSASLIGNSPATGNGLWTIISGPNSPTIASPTSANTSVNGMIAGTYVFRWSISNGVCTSSTDDISITIYPTPTVANAGPDQNLCNVTTVTLAGNPATSGTGNWTTIAGPNSPTITSPGSNSSTVTGMIPGTYFFKWSITSGVCTTSLDTVRIIIYATPDVSNAGADQSLCNVTSSTLNGNAPVNGSGTWTLVSGPNTPTITSPSSAGSTVTGMIPGTYVFRWTISNGVCASSSDDVTINIYALPTVSNAGPDQALCSASQFDLAGNNATSGTGAWTLVSGPNSPVFTNASLYNTQVTGVITGTYVFRWSISNGVCAVSTDDIQIINFSSPTAVNAGPDQDICNSATTVLAANVPSSGTGTWTVISGPNSPTFSSVNNPTATLSSLVSGTYILGWTIVNGSCTTTADSVTLNVYSLPTVANAGPDQAVCSATSVTMSGNTPAIGAGTWSVISGPNSPTITDPTDPTTTITGLIPGTYIFRWTITNGNCAASTNNVQVDIYNIPLVVDAGADQQLCNATSVIMAGNTPSSGSGLWNVISSASAVTFVDNTDPNTIINGLIAGSYSFGWTINNGVCSTPTDTIQVIVFDLPSSANAGSDINLCDTTATVLSAVAATIGNGTWSVLSGPNTPVFADSTDNNSSISNLIYGTYSLVWTVSNGVCASNTDTINLTNLSTPPTANAGVDQDLCDVTSITMAANNAGAAVGIWTFISGPNSPTISNPTNENSIVTGMIPGNYIFSWTISNSVCTSTSDSVLIKISALPTVADAGPDQNLCNVTATTMNAVTLINGSGIWNQIGGPNASLIDSTDNPKTAVSAMIPGVYTFTWTVSNGACATTIDTVNISIDELPSIADAGPDQSLCNDTMISLSATTPLVGTGNWNFISGPNTPTINSSSSAVTTVSGIVPGTYVFEWSVSNGVCATSYDSVSISVSAIPLTVNAGPDQELCNVTSTNLNANVPSVGTGQWSLISGSAGSVFVSPNDPASLVNNLSPGVYQFGWTITNGSCVTNTDTVTITIYASSDIAVAGIDQSLCNVNSTNLAANTPVNGIGTWTFITGPNSPVINSVNNENTSVSNLIEGTYLFSWSIENGICSTTNDTVSVSVFDLPSTAICGSDQVVCNSGSITIDADQPVSGTGLWTINSGPAGAVISSPGSPVTTVSGITSGQYVFYWTISNGSCTSTVDSLLVTVSGNVTTPNAGADQSFCNINSIQLNGNSAINGSGLWSFVTGSGTIVSPSSENTLVNNLSAGMYTLQWTISNGACIASDEVLITIHPQPSVAINSNFYNACGNRVTMIASGADTYVWTPSAGLSDPTIYDPVADPNETTTYYVVGTDLNGCTATDSAIVEICDTLDIPNGFSPDDDGVNDEFVITGIDKHPGNVLKIFNRWGNILYEKTNYNNSWNGNVNTGSFRLGGGKVPAGTYFYILELGQGEKPRSGFVVIRY